MLYDAEALVWYLFVMAYRAHHIPREFELTPTTPAIICGYSNPWIACIELIMWYDWCWLHGILGRTMHTVCAYLCFIIICYPSIPIPDSKVHGAIMGPIWSRQDPGGPHVGRMNLTLWDVIQSYFHFGDVIMSTMASQITSLTIVYSIVCSGAGQRKHLSSASLAFVRGIHRGPVNSPHKGPVTRKMFLFDDVIMTGTGFFTLTWVNEPWWLW